MRLSSMIPGAFAALALAACAPAQPPAAPAQNTTAQPVTEPTIGAIAPVFNQLVYYRVPARFVSVYENKRGTGYIHEWVPPGESVSNWTQMISATGVQNLVAKNPGATPKVFATGIASGFQRACPASFVAKGLYEGKLNAQDTFVMVVGCGEASASAGHSEMAAIVVIKGAKDFYTLQWAQRGSPMSRPVIDDALWESRIKMLMPFKLCSIRKGEKAPYPSCVRS